MHALETPRLLLRPYRAEDWQEVHRYASIPELSQYDVWGPNSAEDTKRFVADCIAHFAKDPVQRYDLAVERKNSEVFVGGCTLKLSTDDPDEAYLGYAISPLYQCQGYATEAAVALIRFAFEDLGRWLVYAQCDTRNIASRRVMEKSGMKFARVLRNDRVVKGMMTDSYRYEINSSEDGRE
jgi:ribosomal-protein-alanine N-acetyltransferase